MAAAALLSRDVRIAQTCDVAKEFVERFYKRIDQERHMVKPMYNDDGKLIFNGNGFLGLEAIGKFYENLPKSNIRVHGFDAHEIDEKYCGTPAILISTVGYVKYGGRGERSNYDERGNPVDPKTFVFFETFVITAKSGTWKIQSDNLRFQNSNTESMLKEDLWNVNMQE